MILCAGSLTFRIPDEHDASWLYRLVNDALWARFIGDRGVTNEDDAVIYAQRCQKQFSVWGYGLMAVEQAGSGEPLGLCGLIDRGWFTGPDVGFALLPEARGSGVATRAVKATCEWAFSDVGVPFLTAMTHPQNRASQAVIQACGFEKEGKISVPESQQVQMFYRLDRPQSLGR